MKMHRLTILAMFLLFALPQRLRAEEANEDQTAKLFLALHDQVLSRLLKDSPPSTPFTFALVYDDRGKAYKPLPEELKSKLLAIEGVDPNLFVPSGELVFPYQQKHEKGEDGKWTGVAVLEKETDKRVAVYYVRSFSWRGEDGIVAHWLVSGGAMAGFGGEDLLRFRNEGWRWIKTLTSYDR